MKLSLYIYTSKFFKRYIKWFSVKYAEDSIEAFSELIRYCSFCIKYNKNIQLFLPEFMLTEDLQRKIIDEILNLNNIDKIKVSIFTHSKNVYKDKYEKYLINE